MSTFKVGDKLIAKRSFTTAISPKVRKGQTAVVTRVGRAGVHIIPEGWGTEAVVYPKAAEISLDWSMTTPAYAGRCRKAK